MQPLNTLALNRGVQRYTSLKPCHFAVALPSLCSSHQGAAWCEACRGAERKDGAPDPKWFRPGHGWVRQWMFPILRKHGYRMALGRYKHVTKANSYTMVTQ
eukprot:8203072-Pyramimonas_sp.AAC.1